MTRPTIGVYCAFANNPFVADSALTWTDISSDVLLDPAMGGGPIAIRRGRQNELGRIEAGTLSLTLDNRARKYDPEYTSSPYYPNIKPLKRIQVRAVWNSTTYKLFTGYVGDWAPSYPGGRQAVTRVRASDALNPLARTTVSVTSLAPGEFAHFAIRTALNLIGWPYITDYVYSNGQTRIAPGSYLNLNGLQYIQQIVETENALFFARGDGLLVFQDRHYRINNASSVATFGTNSGELPYETAELSYDEQLIYNDVRIMRAGGAQQQAIDSTSQSSYGPRVLNKSGLYFDTDNDSLGMSQWLLLRYKDPALRVPRLTLNGEMSPSALWPHLLGRELSDKITVRVRPPGGGTIEKAARIEAIGHTIGHDIWRTPWDLSLAGEDQYWKLQDAALGVLGTTTRLAF